MTKNEFADLCSELLIAPEIALENENVCAALRAVADASEVRAILESEF